MATVVIAGAAVAKLDELIEPSSPPPEVLPRNV
jgi:hypothetical protein